MRVRRVCHRGAEWARMLSGLLRGRLETYQGTNRQPGGEGCGMSDHTLTYNPNPDGSAPITRCSCGWIAKSGDDVHLISPHAVGMIADQRDLLIAKDAQIATLEAECERTTASLALAILAF